MRFEKKVRRKKKIKGITKEIKVVTIVVVDSSDY